MTVPARGKLCNDAGMCAKEVLNSLAFCSLRACSSPLVSSSGRL